MNKKKETSSVKPRQAVILFADLMNSSLFADTLGIYEYDVLIENFQKIMAKAKDSVFSISGLSKSQVEFSIRGDEAVAVLYLEDVQRNLRTALMLAFYMKTMWLQSQFNINRLSEAKIASDIGVGIHTGKVIVRRRIPETRQYRAEGYAINLAKRIEGLSRRGSHWKIMVSSETRTLFNKYNFSIDLSEQITEEVKGLISPVNVYEIIGFPEELCPIILFIESKNIDLFISVYESKPEDWLAMYIIISLFELGYFKKGYEFIKTNDLQNCGHEGIQFTYWRILKALGHYDAALDTLENIKSTLPQEEDEKYECDRGILTVLRGDLDEGIALIEKSIRSGYQYPYPYSELGKAYLRKFKSDPNLSKTDSEYCINKARECFHNSLERLEGEESLFFLGLIYEILKDNENSKMYFGRCYDFLKDKMEWAKPLKYHYFLCLEKAAYCCIKLGTKEEGRKYLLEAITLVEEFEDSMVCYSYRNFEHVANKQFVKECKLLTK